ncbi:MAG: CoA transferase [Gammaproteobacteria bacterium]|nr:CoA transferase [Gammaproteobacteria bacterium]
MQHQPLSGIRVIEMGSSVAGPYAAWVLAQLGAEVVKVEDPRSGDATRHWGPRNANGNAAVYEVINNGKKSITVNLADAQERAALKRLILEGADIVLQNLRPGFAEQCGVGQSLTQEKPSLIYCDLGAYGKGGAFAMLPGYDPLMQGFTGLAQGTGTEHGPARVAAPVIDFMTGMWAVIGVLGALQGRGHTGAGAAVDVSLMESGIGLMTLFVGLFQSTGERPQRRGLQGPWVAPNAGFETADGLIMIVCGTDSLFHKLCHAIGRTDLLDDTRFSAATERFTHRVALQEEIEAVLRTRPRAHWLECIGDAQVPVAPVHHVDEMMDHPQTLAVDILDTLPQAGDGGNAFKTVRLPVRINGRRTPYQKRAPDLGEHNNEIFGNR